MQHTFSQLNLPSDTVLVVTIIRDCFEFIQVKQLVRDRCLSGV